MSITVQLSNLWKALYKQPRNRLKEERFLKRRLAFVDAIKHLPGTFDKEIIIIRTDDIGDYILFRSTLELLRKARPEYKITLVGHALWKPIAERWDADFIDEFIGLQKGRFISDENYARQFLEDIAAKKPEIIIAPSYSRNPFIDDVIARLLPARQKWGWQRTARENKKWLRGYVDAAYTHTQPIPGGLHEFDLNTRFMELATGQKSAYNQPYINPQQLPVLNGLPQKYAVLFPGAAAKRKRWDTANFAQTADYLYQKHGLHSLVCGAKGDAPLAGEILKFSKNPTAIMDYTGKTDLLQLATVINGCRLIITNDTSAAHYAAALGKKTIALLSGNSYGRFFPYPAQQHPNIKPLYPLSVQNPPYDWAGMGDIQQISVNRVINEVEQLLNR